MKASLAEIAQWVGGEVIGDDSIEISLLSPIDNIQEGALVFADGKENFKRVETSKAAAVLTGQAFESSAKSLILVSEPLQAFIKLLNQFKTPEKNQPGIHPTAIIEDAVVLGENVSIGPYVVVRSGSVIGDHSVLKGHVYIGEQVRIGSHALLYPQVTIYDHSVLGNRVTIHASTVIGSDGFGYTWIKDQHVKMPHIGRVVIEDDVEIGANTVVDKATLGDTRIGMGTKIDNLVQVAHSVSLGRHNILCAFTGIAGSSHSGDNVVFAANVGVSDHVTIDSNVILGARAGVPPKKHLLEGNIYIGNPARPKNKAIEQELSVTRLPLMKKNMSKLKETVSALSKRIEKLETETL